MATNAPQGHALGTVAVLPLDPLVIDPSQGYVRLGHTATNLSLGELAIETSQVYFHPCSATSDSSFDESKTQTQWKDRWNEKMLLVYLKREGRDWEYIIKVFRRMDKKPKGQSGWMSMCQRAAHDIGVLSRAARADREGEIDRLGDFMTYH
ncbi:hypothetical protein BGZ60DRAFT_421740 [Tricladium varicosporioides]|nr:hypothetical protein BGZ60DRAFT_421740 [Hymenoscyphus varicosporioides]